MLYMLDTDICSYTMRKGSEPILAALEVRVEAGHQICLSVITYMELRLGAERSAAKNKYHRLIDEFSDRLDLIADWTRPDADRFAQIQAGLFAQGSPIGHNDTMIAAHALSLNAILVTNNQKHFSQVTGLVTENWLQ